MGETKIPVSPVDTGTPPPGAAATHRKRSTIGANHGGDALSSRSTPPPLPLTVDKYSNSSTPTIDSIQMIKYTFRITSSHTVAMGSRHTKPTALTCAPLPLFFLSLPHSSCPPDPDSNLSPSTSVLWVAAAYLDPLRTVDGIVLQQVPSFVKHDAT